MRNLLTDVAGVKVGNASDDRLKSGVTVVVCDTATIAGVQVLGGGPGTRETDVMSPENSVETVDAIVLSGGSAFGLDAASGVMDALAAEGRGFAVGPIHVPIVPSAVLFDLANGGDKNWGPASPYRRLGAAALVAAGEDFALGSVGAGTGATLANLKGGLGSASARTSTGITVAAIVAVNAVGVATVGGGPHFWASPFEIGDEFGGLGFPSPIPGAATEIRHKLRPRQGENTTIAVVATDAHLTKSQAKRLAIMAHAGFARAIWPSHTPFDGDTIFALATGRKRLGDTGIDLIEIGAAASACVARAVGRGIYEATAAPGDRVPAWRVRFGQKA
jgi:L-aminopeptidase/D-esterase-like protein